MPYLRIGRRLIPFAIVLLAALTTRADESAKKPADAPKSPALPATLAGFEDAGTFHLYKSEEQLVTIEFTWKTDGTFENKSVLSVAGQSLKNSFTVTSDKDGRWEKITGSRGDTNATIVRKGDVAEVTTKDKTEKVELKPNTV